MTSLVKTKRLLLSNVISIVMPYSWHGYGIDANGIFIPTAVLTFTEERGRPRPQQHGKANVRHFTAA